jgi:hypothetical protein
MFVVSSSLGSVKLFKIDGSEPHVAEFKELISWDDIHFFRYAERAVACNMEYEYGSSCLHFNIVRVWNISHSLVARYKVAVLIITPVNFSILAAVVKLPAQK